MKEELKIYKWNQLYNIAEKLRKMKPWEALCDLDLITLYVDGSEEPILCSITGKNGQDCGIGIYIGSDQIHKFYCTLNSDEMPELQLLRYEDKIICHFEKNNDLLEVDIKRLNEVGIYFDKGDEPIYFRRYEPGFIPCILNDDEVIEMTEILNNLYKALIVYFEGIEINFKGGETLRRSFDLEKNRWITYSDRVFTPEISYKIPMINDEVLIKRLQKKEKSNDIIELDIAFLNKTYNDKKYEKTIIPRVGIIADTKGNIHLSEKIVLPNDNIYEIILNLFINIILENGKPKKVIVRDRLIESCVSVLCNDLGINIETSQKLYNIDNCIEELIIE